MALYRKYRPATFAEVVGQEHVTVPLSNALASRGPDGKPDRINHAYLFSGPRGCGKTSSARILARSLNCAEGPTATPCGRCESCLALAPGGVGHLDVVELDAASHNGVEDMRELRDKAMYPPASSRYTIFIIDEAHMVTNQGFNALLKVVEEPPEHLIFVFATTEPEKVLPTIRSRTHHYPFRLLAPKDMRGLLERIVADEGVTVDPQVYPLVIAAGGGSPRDSLSILDQLVAGSGAEGVTYELATALLGVTDQSLLDEAVEALAGLDRAGLFGCVDRAIDAGLDPRRFAEDLLAQLRDLMVLAAVPDAVSAGLVEAPGDRAEVLAGQARAIPQGALTRYAEVLHRGIGEMRGATSQRLLLEVLCARMLLPGVDGGVESLVQRVEALERGRPAPGGAADVDGAGDDDGDGHAGGVGAAAFGGGDGGPGDVDLPGAAGDGGAGTPEPGAGRRALEEYRRRRAGRASGAAPDQGSARPQAGAVQREPAPENPAPEKTARPESPRSAAPAETDRLAPATTEPAQQDPAQREPVREGAPESAPPADPVQDLLAARQAARRMQEVARQQEREERERIALEKERAARRAEGLPEDPDDGAAPDPAAHDGHVPGRAAASPAPTGPAGDADPPRPPSDAAPSPEPGTAPEEAAAPGSAEEAAPGSARETAGERAAGEDRRPAVDVDTLRATWADVMEAVSAERLPARVMAAQATPLELDGGELVAGHHTGALVDRLNAEENAAAVGAAIRQVHGVDLRVRFVIGRRSGTRPRQRGAAAAAPDAESSDGAPGPGPRPAPGDRSAPARPEPGRAEAAPPQPSDPAPAARPASSRHDDAAGDDTAGAAGDDAAGAASESGRPVPRWKALAQQRRRIEAQEQARRQAQQAAGQETQAAERHRAAPPTRPPTRRRAPAAPPPPPEPAWDDVPPPEPYDDVPPPPEPWDDGPPSEDAAGPGGPGAAASGPGTPVGPAPASPPSPEDEEREYIEAAHAQAGSLDHRTQREVVIEMLEKELGARLL